MISLSWESRPNVISTETSTAQGAESATMYLRDRDEQLEHHEDRDAPVHHQVQVLKTVSISRMKRDHPGSPEESGTRWSFRM